MKNTPKISVTSRNIFVGGLCTKPRDLFIALLSPWVMEYFYCPICQKGQIYMANGESALITNSLLQLDL